MTSSAPNLTNASPNFRTLMTAPVQENIDEINAQVALLGVPYDYGTFIPLMRQGTSRGPDAVRNSPTYWYDGMFGGEEPAAGWYDVEEETDYLQGVTMVDCGDVAFLPGEGGQGADGGPNIQRITDVVKRIAARDALVVAVGGDHSMSFPVGRGMERYESIDVVHFDAHHDYMDEIGGARFTHGNNLRRLSELPFVRNLAMIGVMGPFFSRQIQQDARDRGVNVVSSKKFKEDGAAVSVDEAVRPAKNIYVSIDIDVLDMGIVPGTTLPEPTGVPYELLRDALREVCKKGRIVGFDIVELSPSFDFGGGTARLTSWLITHFLGDIFASQK